MHGPCQSAGVIIRRDFSIVPNCSFSALLQQYSGFSVESKALRPNAIPLYFQAENTGNYKVQGKVTFSLTSFPRRTILASARVGKRDSA
jgi:hypothetical protein